MAKRRQIPDGYLFIDTTVKSGIKLFSPTWEMVLAHKSGSLSNEDYIKQYKALMRDSIRQNKEIWLDLCNSSGPVVLACYCKSKCFCHRYLLVDIFEKLCNHYGIEFEYFGEL